MIIKIRHKVVFTVLIVIVAIQLFILTADVISIVNTNGTAIDGKVAIPIILYHSILKREKITDRYAVTPNQLENDLVYIRDNGYTTITMSDLIGYVHGNGTLPEKPIIITFDDGFLNTYIYAYPLLKNMK